jgi:tetratricopeptide (TPR) repeat protein
MVSSARIDELRKKFDENPRRYFAPLANEYRKGGDLEQAIFICQEYLPQQPGHMSGHIVYGQALFELGRHDDAKVVFETALSLDPENLIALRHLGDIARAAGDIPTAHAWYQRVLEADPRNEEIAAILTEMAAMPTVPTAPVAASAADGTEMPVSSTAPTPLSTPALRETAADTVAAPTPDHTEPPPIVPVVEHTEQPASPPPAAAVAAATTNDELLDLDDFDLGGESAPSIDLGETPPEPHIERATDIELGLPDDGTSSPTFTERAEEIPNLPGLENFESGVARAGAGNVAPTETDSFFDLPTGEREILPSGSGGEQPTAGGEFATETMAELYLQQGHLDSALSIYRTLVAHRPNDEALRGRMNEVERRAHRGGAAAEPTSARVYGGPTIREFLAGIVNRPVTATHSHSTATSDLASPPSPPSPPTSAARPTPSSPSDTVSGSIDALFSGASSDRGDALAASTLADAFAADSPETAPLRGMPAHRAASELSLDHVFKSTSSQRSSSEVDRKSFDEFFSEEPPPLPTNGESSAKGEPNDDVQHFNSWLSGLKKP